MTGAGHARWATRDAQRIHRRIRHLAYTGHPLTPEQIAYLRAQVMGLLIGPLADQLPDGWADDLRDLLSILEDAAADFDEESAP